jgi:hypothetical protein
MALTESTRYKRYDPVVSTTTFLVTFPIFDDDEVGVLVDGVEVTAFSVTATFNTGTGRANDAAVVLATAVSGVSVEIYGNRAARADGGYSGNAARLTEVLGNDFDRLAAVQQETARDLGRAPKVPMSEVGTEYTLDVPVAGRALTGKTDGSGWENGASTSEIAYANAVGTTTGGFWVTNVAALIASTTFGYSAGAGIVAVTAGAVIQTREEGLSFRVLPLVSVDEDLTTAGGVLIEVLPTAEGYDVRSFGALLNGTTDDTAAFQAAINRSSKSAVNTIRIPSGTLLYSVVYGFYDATLNPGFLNPAGGIQRHGSFRFAGDGEVEISKIRQNELTYGSVVKATGDGIVISRVSLGHDLPVSGGGVFPARAFQAEGITFVASKANQYVLEIPQCPFIKMTNCSVVQQNVNGFTAYLGAMWFAKIEGCVFVSPPGATKENIVAGTREFAGLYTFTNCLIDGGLDGFHWTQGEFVNVSFNHTAFQSASRNSFRASGGAIQQLMFNDCYFETQTSVTSSRDCDIRGISNSIRTLIIDQMFVLAGAGPTTSYITDRIINLDSVNSVNIRGVHLKRLSKPFMNITALTNSGQVSGYVENLDVANDTGAYTGTPIFLFEGILPDFGPGIIWPGFNLGYDDASSAIRLYNPAVRVPFNLCDRFTGTTMLRRWSAGPVTQLEAPTDGAYPTQLNTGTFLNVLVTAAAAVACFLPLGAIFDGRVWFIRNDPASPFDLTLRNFNTTTNPLVTSLRPGQDAIVVYDAASGGWTERMIGLVRRPDFSNLTDSTGGTAGSTLVAVGASYSQTEMRNNLASLAAEINRVKAAIREGGLLGGIFT